MQIVGFPQDATKIDGFLPPTIKGDELAAKNYTLDQTGTIIFVTNPATTPSGQVINVTTSDYYFFDGVVWQSFKPALYDVVMRGNYSPKNISFTGSSTTKQGTLEGSLGYNSTTKSFYFGALNPLHTGNYNVTLGLNTGFKITTGYSNTITGTNSGQNITTAYENSLYGKDSGNALVTGMWNAGFGEGSLYNITDGLMNTGIGDGAVSISSGRNVYNTGVGSNSLRHGGGSKNGNIGLGVQAGYKITGNNNVFIGNGTGYNITDSNKLYIHNNRILDNGTNGGAGAFQEYVGINSLIYGDFVARWLRINGSLQLSPSYVKTADTSYDKVLVYNNTTGDVGISNTTNLGFIPLPGTQAGFPITGDLSFKNDNALGGVSLKATTQGSYIKFWDDGVIEINKNSGSNVNIAGLDISGIGAAGKGIEGSFYYGTNYKDNSFVQKRYVDESSIPLNGTYVGKNINGNIIFNNGMYNISNLNGNGLYLYPFGLARLSYDGSGTTKVETAQNYALIQQGNTSIRLDNSSNNGQGILINDGSPSAGGIYGAAYYGANYSDNSYVQKKYVDDKVSTISVPTPPTTGTYILKSINGIMTWIAE